MDYEKKLRAAREQNRDIKRADFECAVNEIRDLRAALTAKTQELETLKSGYLDADAELQLLRPIAISVVDWLDDCDGADEVPLSVVFAVNALTPEQRAALLATAPPPLDVQAGSEGEP